MRINRLAHVFGRISDMMKVPSRLDQERDYLNNSVSIHDLERRQHEIESGKFRR